MAGVYVDASALGRVLLDEPSAPAVGRALGGFSERVSSRLLAVELRRLSSREGLAPEHAERLLDGVSLVPLEASILERAERLAPAALGTLDAIHLTTALRLQDRAAIDAILTYDRALAAGAAHHGLEALTP